MTKQEEIQLEIDKLEKIDANLKWLHKESQDLAIKLMNSYPHNWQSELKKMPRYQAICTLIKLRKKERINN